jgi:hypothetical protein
LTNIDLNIFSGLNFLRLVMFCDNEIVYIYNLNQLTRLVKLDPDFYISFSSNLLTNNDIKYIIPHHNIDLTRNFLPERTPYENHNTDFIVRMRENGIECPDTVYEILHNIKNLISIKMQIRTKTINFLNIFPDGGPFLRNDNHLMATKIQALMTCIDEISSTQGYLDTLLLMPISQLKKRCELKATTDVLHKNSGFHPYDSNNPDPKNKTRMVISAINSFGFGGSTKYKEKYLKYKQKYLSLKKN